MLTDSAFLPIETVEAYVNYIRPRISMKLNAISKSLVSLRAPIVNIFFKAIGTLITFNPISEIRP